MGTHTASIIFRPYGVLAFTATPLYKALREHHQLLESPYPPSIGPGVGICAIVGCIGFVWNFVTYIPCCSSGNDDGMQPMFLVSASIDLSIFILLFASTILQAQFLPHPLVSCGKQATWKVPANHSSIFEALAKAKQNTDPAATAYDECISFKYVWAFTIVLLPMVLFAGCVAVLAAFVGWCCSRPRCGNGARLERLERLRRQEMRQQRRWWQCWRPGTRERTHQRRRWWEPEKIYYLRRLWSRLRTTKAPTKETHQELQDNFTSDQAGPNTCDHRGTPNTRTTCWACGMHYCAECAPNTTRAMMFSKTHHLTHCNPLCKKCFIGSLCQRNSPATCSCTSSDSLDSLELSSAQSRPVCSECYGGYAITSTNPLDAGYNALGIRVAKQQMAERELLRLGLETRNCGDCADPLSDLEPRWWRCNRCFGECMDPAHPGVVYEGWA